MKLDNLKKIRDEIGLEIGDSFKEVGTDDLHYLCYIDTLLKRLINNLEKKSLNKIRISKTIGSCITGGIMPIEDYLMIKKFKRITKNGRSIHNKPS